MCPGRGSGSGSGWWWGGWGFPVENEGKRGRRWRGWGGGVGTGKGTGKSMRTRLSKLPFSDLPFCFTRNIPNVTKIIPKMMALWKKHFCFRRCGKSYCIWMDPHAVTELKSQHTIGAQIITYSHFCFGQELRKK